MILNQILLPDNNEEHDIKAIKDVITYYEIQTQFQISEFETFLLNVCSYFKKKKILVLRFLWMK